MTLDYFESSRKKLLETYNVDVFKDILFGRKGRVFLFTDIEQKEQIVLQVISNHLTVIGLDDGPSIELNHLLSFIDTDNKYAEVSGVKDYIEYVRTEMTAFQKEINISFPIITNNKKRWVHFNGFPIEKSSKIYVFLAHDISDLMNHEEEMFDKAHKDSLTGLFNKYTFDYHYGLRYQLENLHVLYLDLDNFKNINDHYGHNIGNVALKSFSNLLKSLQNGYNQFYRLGGDEFVGLFFGEKNKIISLVEYILNETRKIVITKDNINLTVSVGVIQATRREDLARKADEILYKAKKRGKDQYLFEIEQ
jgi:diguanylate cyclase